MYGCEILFDAVTAEEVKTEVRAMMGGQCPCDVGRKCPLLPEPVFAPPEVVELDEAV